MFVFQLDHLGDKGPVPVTAAGILSEREATQMGETHTESFLRTQAWRDAAAEGHCSRTGKEARLQWKHLMGRYTGLKPSQSLWEPAAPAQ